MTAQVAEPVPPERTNWGLSSWALDLRCALRRANYRLAAIAAWSTGGDAGAEPVCTTITKDAS